MGYKSLAKVVNYFRDIHPLYEDNFFFTICGIHNGRLHDYYMMTLGELRNWVAKFPRQESDYSMIKIDQHHYILLMPDNNTL